MKYYILAFLFLNINFKSIAQDNNKIEIIAIIEILNDSYAVIDTDTIPLNSTLKKVSQLFNESNLKQNDIPSITLVVNPSVSENSIENIKYQIRSTPIQLINLQRKIITNYDGIEINQNVLDQYNSLISYWNDLQPEDRFYRDNDLKFVESVALNMTMDQRIRNEKLPGYLPFVKEESKTSHLSMLDEDPRQAYIYVYKNDTLDKDTAHSNYNDIPYVLKRRILNEENVNVIELIED
ncbi:hypothetical protein LB452_12345 [Psychroflexus sp. CAK8W]|uniref:Uncharacterized protein n=1 Tax=Psychroflexus longus TaxID=2873596 RepID=A0ABS7XLA4_9FLAO|nr:hypothetical protein [Psychroflexus longus]MBZ9779713.1 hypothetical protein [Psychroflexus longus]